MPKYEYQCPKCGQKIEMMLDKEEDGSKLSCPKCGSKNLKLLTPQTSVPPLAPRRG